MDEQILKIEFFGKSVDLKIMKVEKFYHNAERGTKGTDLSKSISALTLSDNSINGQKNDDEEEHLNSTEISNCSNSPNQVFEITRNTKIEITQSKSNNPNNEIKLKPITFESIGGMANEIDKLKQHVLVPLQNPLLFQQAGLSNFTCLV